MPAKIEVSDDVSVKMLAMYDSGYSCKDVGVAFGFSNKGTVRKILISAGAVMNRGRSISKKATGRPSALKGRTKTPEQIEKMRQARIGKPGKKGYVFSDESRARMRETRLRLIAENPDLLKRMRDGWSARERMSKDEVVRREKQRFAYKRLVRRLLTTKKCGRSADLLGYTREQFVAHIENQFKPGMGWGGDTQIDHIVPVAAFFEFGIVDPKIVNALCNLRPMNATDNRKKSDKYPRENFEDDLEKILSTIEITSVSDNGRTAYKQGIK